MSQRSQKMLGPVCLLAILTLTLAVGLEFVRAERPNQDEGWYLYAARLVSQGQRPYVDFAYVQPPLLPYVYAALDAETSLTDGRRVSLGFALLTVLLVGLAGWRAGPIGGLVAASLLALCPFALSQMCIVKAYALANACLALGLLCVLRGGRNGPAVAAAAVAFALAALTRNSAAPALLAFWLWLLLARDRRRLFPVALLVGLAVLAAGYAPFLATDAAAVKFHLVTHHARNAPREPLGQLVVTMLAVLWLMIKACPALSLSLLGGMAWRVGGEPAGAPDQPEVDLALLVMVLVGLGHFVSAHPYQEYQVLTLPAATVLAGLLWGRLAQREYPREIAAVLVALVGVLPLLLLPPAVAALWGNRRDAAGQVDLDGSHARLRDVARLVRELSGQNEPIFTFQTDVAIEADRALLPGLTLASFSFTDLPQAERFDMVNPASLLRAFQQAEAAVVVLSDGDLHHILRGEFGPDHRVVPLRGLDAPGLATYGPIVAGLDAHYRYVTTVDGVGQFGEPYHVLARR